MKRKRFVKLLMSYGMSRNSAQAVAKKFNRCEVPYKRAIWCYAYPTVLGSVRRATIHVASLGAFALAVKKKGDNEK